MPSTASTYRPLRTLGAGGMAKVTLAVDETSGSHVVLKRTLTGSATDEKRLRVEGNLGRRLNHRAIVRTIDLYDDEEGHPVVVLEYVPGLSMSALRGGGPLAPALCAVVGQHVAEALHVIHTAVDDAGMPMHMLHRDVTPANIIVDLDGQAKLIDLGIARAAGANLTLTSTGEVRGTLRYLAPELFQGEKQSRSTDLWALGIVILEAALGEPLHKGSTAEVIARILKQSPLTQNVLDRVHPDIARVLASLLATDPSARAHDASAVALAFAGIAAKLHGDERALATHVRAVVNGTSARSAEGGSGGGEGGEGGDPDADEESWSSLLDARAQLSEATTRLARKPSPTATTVGSGLAAPQRSVRVGVIAGVAAAAAIAVVAVTFLPDFYDVDEDLAPVPAPVRPVTKRAAPVLAPGASNDIAPEDPPPPPTALWAQQVLLPSGSVWRYDDQGTDPGRKWREPTFDDRKWSSGKAKLGYGGDGEVTVLSYGPDEKNKHPAAYFRTTFHVDAKTAALAKERGVLVASVVHDDGVALYLNGVEVLRSGLASNATHRDWALQVVQRGRGELEGQIFRLSAKALKPGKNVLAAEVHQADATSTDLAFDVELAIPNDK